MSKTLIDNLKLLDYTFVNAPMLVGGLALEQHNIRKVGADIDIMVSKYDWNNLKEKYSSCLNLFGGKDEYDVDATLNITLSNGVKLDIIFSLWQYDYIDFLKDSKLSIIDDMYFLTPSLVNLLIVKCFPGILEKHEPSHNDIELILKKLVKDKYKK